MTVSIITVVFNCEDFIGDCLDSIYAQTYPNIEHIIIDGASSDGTLNIIRAKANKKTILVSEKDLGYYHALNKGILLSTGSIIGILNADDQLAGKNVIQNIVLCFTNHSCQAVYGNLNYVKRFSNNIIERKWRDKGYNVNRFLSGWMPPHPALFLHSELFSINGFYSLSYGTCSDYDLIIRFLYLNRTNTVFLDELIVCMRSGGMSNGSLAKVFQSMKQDYKILVLNGFSFCWFIVILKRLRKLRQLL
jgi:glycosyltransferase involved in cell wall biosynthesis